MVLRALGAFSRFDCERAIWELQLSGFKAICLSQYHIFRLIIHARLWCSNYALRNSNYFESGAVIARFNKGTMPLLHFFDEADD